MSTAEPTDDALAPSLGGPSRGEPSRGGDLLAEAKFNWGYVPEQTQRLAQVVDALDGYGALVKKFEMTSLSPIEQQVVYIATSRVNGCAYCVAAHTHDGRQAGMSEAQLNAARAGSAIGDARLDALQEVTMAIVRGKGRVSASTVDTFIAAGFLPEQVYEILIGIAAKMLVNFFNEIAGTPLDDEYSADVWTPPAQAADPSAVPVRTSIAAR